MVRTCKIISQWLGAVLSDKDRTCILHFHHIFKGIGCHDLHMFRSDFIGCLNRLVHILCNQNVSKVIKRLLNDFFSGKNLHETFYFFIYFLRKFFTCSDQDSTCQFIMLCLGKKVSCHKMRISCLICKNKDLTRSCNGVNAYIAIYCFLCKSYENVSGTYDLVYLRNTLCSESKGTDRLCTTHLINLICSCFFGCYQCGSAYFAILSGRCCHNNMRNSCHFRRYNIHQYRRRINCFSTGYIDTHTI